MSRILVIDDHPDTAESLADLLSLFDHVAVARMSGSDAVSAAIAMNADVVLSDLQMRPVSGFEVAQEICACPELAHVRLLAMSGITTPEQQDRALACGFEALLQKPLDPEKLLVTLAGG